MRVIVMPDAEAVGQRAADFVERLVRAKPECVLGLATGSTPLGLYRELIRRHQETGLSFAGVTTFNLDEYVGLPPEHEQSYHHFMHENLFQHIDVPADRVHVPDGLAADFEQFGNDYEERIRAAGGIDLQVLGIGSDGHIAFNEPGSSLGGRTRLAVLAPETIRDNARFFNSRKEVPRLAITMGVGTIMDSRQCLLLATGKKKAKAIAATVEGPVTTLVTASALQWHPNTVLIIDEEAAEKLKRRPYYDEAEESWSRLERGEPLL